MLYLDFTAFQKLFVRVNKYEIVHISNVVLYAEALFYIVIEIAENGERHELRYLRAEPDSYFSEAIHNFASVSSDFAVFYSLTNSRLCYVVPYASSIKSRRASRCA